MWATTDFFVNTEAKYVLCLNVFTGIRAFSLSNALFGNWQCISSLFHSLLVFVVFIFQCEVFTVSYGFPLPSLSFYFQFEFSMCRIFD